MEFTGIPPIPHEVKPCSTLAYKPYYFDFFLSFRQQRKLVPSNNRSHQAIRKMNKSKKKLWFLLFTILYVMASSEEPEPSTIDATVAPPSNAPPAPPAPEAPPVPASAGNDNQPNEEIKNGENGEKPGEKPEEEQEEEKSHEKHEHDHVDENKTKDPFKFAKDVSHIRQHLMEQYGFNDKQADQYLKEYDAQTQFFVLHDYDKNTKLDGLELLKSMTHYHDDHDDAGGHHDHDEESDNTDTLVEFVDMILKDQDYNNDGYIDYPEYINYYAKFDKSN